MLLFFAALGIAAVLYSGLKVRKYTRRKRLLAEPLSKQRQQILKKRFPAFSLLPPDVRDRLVSVMNVFLDEKRFEACGGLSEVTEEMKVLVAAQACLLLAGLDKHGYFPRLRSILIYPNAYQDRRRRTFDLQRESNDVRLGESWDSGSVVLAWKSVVKGAKHEDDGVNVVYHEFAHQLDQIDYSADGAPPLLNAGNYKKWAEVFGREYEKLVEAAEDPGSDPLLDTYGAKNPAEFFAVATEAFFEIPKDLKKEHPDLYEQLAIYYGVDPSRWM